MPEGLRLRKLADKSEGERVAVTHPLTGDRALYTPEDAATLNQRLAKAFEGIDPTPWPLAGVSIENADGAPQEISLTPRLVEQGRAEGWITTSPAEQGEIVFRSSGPRESPWLGSPHVFVHYDQITINAVDGSQYVYDVVENPDKWPEEKDGTAGFGGEVRHYYELQLTGVHEPEVAAGEWPHREGPQV